jgi:GNAT superfamily N-acetyltransferase
MAGLSRSGQPGLANGHTGLMLVRPAQPSDAAAVAGVHVRSWQGGSRGLLPDEYLDALRPEDRAARYTFGDPDPLAPLTIVAVEAGTICGFASIGPCQDGDADGSGELLALYVDPDRWGLGIGRSLMVEARGRLLRHGFARARLWLLAGNRRAERFYRIDGWEPDGARRQGEVWDLAVDELRYRRGLP